MIKKSLFLVALVVAMLQSALIASAQDIYYVVQPGDTLSGISLFYDVSVEAIANCNDIINPALIDVGMELRIPLETWPCATGLGDAPGSQPASGPWPGSTQSARPESGVWPGATSTGPWTPTPSPDDPPATPAPVVDTDEAEGVDEAEDVVEEDSDDTDAVEDDDTADSVEPVEDVEYTVYTTTVVVTTTQVVTASTEIVGADGVTQTIVLTTTIPVAETVVLTLTEPVETSDEIETVEADMDEADMDEADMDEADMDEADMDEADMDEADMDEADMDEADMDEADMDEADMDEADMDEADMDEAEMDEAEMDEVVEEPTQAPVSTPLPTPWPTKVWLSPTPVPPPSFVEHTVTAGESLIYLSVIYDISVECIINSNNITNPDLVGIGQVLRMYLSCGQPEPVMTATPNWAATPRWSSPTPLPIEAVATEAPVVEPTEEPTEEPTAEPTTEEAEESEDADDSDDADDDSAAETESESDVMATPTLILTIDPLATEESDEPEEEATAEPEPTAEPTEEAAVVPPPANGGGGGAASYSLGGLTNSFSNVAKMKEIGMTWVKLENEWLPGSSADSLKGQIDRVRSEDMKVLVSVTGAPGILDEEAYTDYLGAIAALSPDAIEVWEGQNTDLAWSAGKIGGAAYVDGLLKPAYEKIKAADENVMVISGAPLPTSTFGGRCNTAGCDDVPFIKAMFDADAAQYTDCIGMHFTEGLLSPWERQGDLRDNADHYTRYYPAMVESYREASSDSTPLCFTGLGYLADGGLNPEISEDSLYAWAENTTVLNQADWLGQAVQLSRMDPRVELLIIDNVDKTVWNVTSGNVLADDLSAGYAMVRRDGSCPACENIRTAMGQ